MDAQYTHGTDIYSLQVCPFDDGRDLIAIGGDYGADILLIDGLDCRVIASFHTGSRITALAWSPKSVSPSCSNKWNLELVVANSDYALYFLEKTSVSDESIFKFGGELTGHHGKINDIAFCGGRGENSMRYVASVSDDKMLMIWDLHPNVPVQLLQERPQPTVYAIPFSHALTSIDAHSSSDKEFLVADCKGSIYITDWKSDPEKAGKLGLGIYNLNIVELIDPTTLVLPTGLSGSVAWRPDNADIVGAAYGPRFAIWDIKNLQGGRPFQSGISFPDGGHHFCWCQAYPEYFAIASKAPNQDAVIHIYNLNYINAPPMVFHVAPKPNAISGMDFVCSDGNPRVAVALGRKLILIYLGIDK